MGFEPFNKVEVDRAAASSITLSPRGILSSSGAAAALMDRPRKVAVMFDAEGKRLALRVTDDEDPNAFTATYPSGKDGVAGFLLSADKLLDHYRIRPNKNSWTYHAVFDTEDQMLIVDLKKGVEREREVRTPADVSIEQAATRRRRPAVAEVHEPVPDESVDLD